ncbi:hypothetical protein EKH79_17945 [Dyella dinghuensis]|uniref:PDZ domain-containing protein n=2 Tax=Dyella dinghuensis TaxID=1920169 RepID=A0A3S0RR64_9GAMM|nr:hypothetical protein EKH79_17945 [Dyella dinghuensis]
MVAMPIHGQDSDLQKRYDHISDLRNQGYELVHSAHGGHGDLAKAETLLQEAIAQADQFLSSQAATEDLWAQADSRRSESLIFLAEAYALKGDKNAALNALETMQSSGLYLFHEKILEQSAGLKSLHDEPRFKALMDRYKHMESRWNASALNGQTENLDEAHRIAGLSLFWSEARYNFAHFDNVPDLDWNQAYLDYLPRVIAAKTTHDYYDVMMQFASLLHDGHTHVVPPRAIVNEFWATPAISTSLVEEKVIVTALRSPATRASGLHVGDEIVSIDGQDVRTYALTKVNPYVDSSSPQDRIATMYGRRLLAGDHRQPVTLGIVDAAGHSHSVTLSREGDPHADALSPVVWRMLDGDIAYLAVNEFGDDAGVKAFEQHLPEILHAKGLIIDVRRNGGGSTQNGAAILSYLDKKPIPLSAAVSMDYVPVFRAWQGPYVLWKPVGPAQPYSVERKQHYEGPVAVLIGPYTFSAAEDFVVSFDSMKRGTLLGEATGGSTGQPLTIDLPGGGKGWICSKNDTYPDGRVFVGKGISPAMIIKPTVEDVRNNRDPVIDGATELLRKRDAMTASR